MAEGLFVDVEYRGIDLGRRLEMDTVVAAGAYLHSPAPMPVGTVLVLDPEVNQELRVRVTRVSEQVTGAERPAGMHIEPFELTEAAQQRWDHWAGGPAPTVESQPAAEPAAAVQEAAAEAEPAAEPAAAAQEAAAAEPEVKTKKKKKRSRKKKSK